jgi:hypothetical protein
MVPAQKGIRASRSAAPLNPAGGSRLILTLPSQPDRMPNRLTL